MPVSPAAITGFDSVMTIEETTSPSAGGQPRRVVLMGSGLPKMGAEWGVEQVIVTTWYPGNGDEGTQQVLGPKEMNSSWEGTWRRTLLGRSPVLFRDTSGQESQLVDPMILREVFEDICRQGQLLRVTWAARGKTLLGSFQNGTIRDDDFKIVREGRLKTFSTPIDRPTDMSWKAEFEWVSRGKKQEKVARPNQDEDLAYISNSMIAAQQLTLDTIHKKFGIKQKGAQSLTIGQLVDLAEAPAKIVQRQLTAFSDSIESSLSEVGKVGELAKTLRDQPLTVIQALIAFGRSTVNTAQTFGESMGRIPAELMTTKPGSVSATFRASVYYGQLQDNAEQEQREGVALQAQIRQTTINVGNRAQVAFEDSRSTRQNDVLAVFVAKEGDTPEMVSQRFYNVPDRAQDILRVNRMSWYTPKFKAGQILVIPALSSNQLVRTS